MFKWQRTSSYAQPLRYCQHSVGSRAIRGIVQNVPSPTECPPDICTLTNESRLQRWYLPQRHAGPSPLALLSSHAHRRSDAHTCTAGHRARSWCCCFINCFFGSRYGFSCSLFRVCCSAPPCSRLFLWPWCYFLARTPLWRGMCAFLTCRQRMRLRK